MIDALTLFTEYQSSGLRHKEFWRRHYADTLTYGQYCGRVWRARQNFKEPPPGPDYGLPLQLTGDWMIAGDAQLPTTDWDFAALVGAVAHRYLKKPRQLLIVGDLLNMDAFAKYEQEIGLPSFRQEMTAARQLISEWFRTFQRIVFLPGNHERRASKATSAALLMEDLAMLIDQRMETSVYDRAIINTPTGQWLAAHGSDYSVNQLTVADMLAQKNRMHIIGHHQHHAAFGWDRFKHNVVIDNGGLFNQWQMAYVQLNTSKKPNMQQGFTMLRGGYPYVFSVEPFTDWDFWLPDARRQRKAA